MGVGAAISPMVAMVGGVVGLLLLLAIGLPVAFALAITGVVGIALLYDPHTGLSALGMLPHSTLSVYLYTAVPLFIFMGTVAGSAGVARDAYSVASKWLNRLPGGLAISTIMACAMFAATSGSSIATAVAMGKIAFPEMKRYKYDNKLAAGAITTGGLLGILIPPSIPIIIYGIITGESIGRCLVAGIIPGVLTAVILSLATVIRVKLKLGLIGTLPKITWKERFQALPKVTSVVVLFLVVMGGIYGGIVTPTEAAAAGAVVSVVFLMLSREPKLSNLKIAASESCCVTAITLIIVVGAALFSMFWTYAKVPMYLSGLVSKSGLPPILIVIGFLALYIPLGCFLDPVSMMVVTLPIMYPIVVGLNFSGIWLCILIIKMIEIGLITPPVGITLFAVKSTIPEVTWGEILSGSGWYLLFEFITVGILIVFPDIVLFLPSLMG